MSFSDDFNRADSATVGNGWTENAASLTSILSNKLRFIGGGSFASNVCVAPSSGDFADGEVIVEFVHSGAAVPQMYARWTHGSGNGYIIYYNSNLFRMERITGGGQTSLSTASYTLVAGTNYRMTFTLSGSTKTGVLRDLDLASDVATVSDSADSTYTASASTGVSLHTAGTVDYDNFSSTIEATGATGKSNSLMGCFGGPLSGAIA